MKIVTTEGYFRTLVANKVNRFIKKSKCQTCGNTKNLQIHHAKGFEFSKILAESIDFLKLEYHTYYNEYSKEEIKALSLLILGHHLYSWFELLCEDCHKNKHRENGIIQYKVFARNYKKQIDFYRTYYPKASFDEVMDNFNKLYLNMVFSENKNVYMYKDSIKIFKKKLQEYILVYKSNLSMRHIGVVVIKSMIDQYGLKYKIESKKDHRRPTSGKREKTYWIITEIEGEA